jgi:uncharacterized protein YjiS (DUF1127 family)
MSPNTQVLHRSKCCDATGDAVMATLTRNLPTLSLIHPQGAVRTLSARFQAWRARRRVYAETMRDLAQADSRELRDLGIARYDFDAIARGTYRR